MIPEKGRKVVSLKKNQKPGLFGFTLEEERFKYKELKIYQRRIQTESSLFKRDFDLRFCLLLSSASVSNGPRPSASANSLIHKHSVLESSHDSNSNDRWTHASPLARAEDQPRNRQVLCVCCQTLGEDQSGVGGALLKLCTDQQL